MENTINEIEFINVVFIEKIQTAEHTITFKFEIPKDFNWVEGSHVHLAFDDFMVEGTPDKTKTRTFSIMSQASEKYLGISTRIKDKCSEYKKRLMDLKQGDQMLLFKLCSNMELKRENKDLVFISMGVGIATYRPLIRAFTDNSNEIGKIININIDSSKSFVYEKELKQIANPNLINLFVDSRTKLYATIDEYLAKDNQLFYLVGSNEFLRQISDYLLDHNVSQNDIVIDKKPAKRANFFLKDNFFAWKNKILNI